MQQPTTPTHEMTDEEREARRQELIRRNQALIELMNEWAVGDVEDQEEQRETWSF